MRVDFHCHTKATKKGDGPGRNITSDKFANCLSEGGVEIAAITNHNHFDLQQFQLFSDSCKEIAQIWPGVELDVGLRDGSLRWHMLAITGPNNAVAFSQAVQSLVGQKSPNECLWVFEDALNAFTNIDVIFVSHCHDKKPCLSQDQVDRLLAQCGNKWNMFFEPRQMTTVGIWSNHGYGMLMGSDIKDWNNYQTKADGLPELRLQVSSFEQFCLLAKRDRQVLETLLGSRQPLNILVKPHTSVGIPIPVYSEVNILFGQKGTGKSEIINSLEKHFIAQGKSCSVYRGGEKSDRFNELTKAPIGTAMAEMFGNSNCADEISSILDWSEPSPVEIGKFVAWIKTKNNNANKAKFLLSNCRALPEVSSRKYRRHKTANKTLTAFESSYRSQEMSSYLSEKDSAEFYRLLTLLLEETKRSSQDEYIDVTSTLLANFSLNSLKNAIDAKSETVSMPSSTGFLGFVESRIELYRSINVVLDGMKPAYFDKDEYLGRLEDKGELLLRTRYRYLCPDSKTEEYSGGIQKLKEWKKALQSVSKAVFSNDVSTKVNSFVTEVEQTNIRNLDAFIGVKTFIVFSSSEESYVPSDGEKGILLLERKLNESSDVYLLDEPELGMSNSYIDSVVRPLLQEKGKSGRTVVVATHNANIAVRSLPYSTIFREHVGGNVYRTYSGNPFIDELVDINDELNRKSWSETSIEVLEGGYEAFYDRKNIYEAGVVHERN